MSVSPQIQRRPQITDEKDLSVSVSNLHTALDQRDPVTYAVIGTAMRVHSELGPGLDEIYYHTLFAAQLKAKGVAHESKPQGELIHRDKSADVFECDLLFPGKLITELKTLAGPDTFAPDHFAQLICYLKFWKIATGLLFDFGKERLLHRRVIFTDEPASPADALKTVQSCPAYETHKALIRPICDSLVRICQTHGLGYRDTTYRGLVAAELSAEEVDFSWLPIAAVADIDGSTVGNARCECFVINGRIALTVLALRNQITTTDRAILQTYLKHLHLESGLIVNFGKRKFELMLVTGRTNTKFRL